jgi:excisionase family DNA binding protein
MLLKPSEVTQILGLGRSKVYELIASGQMPSIRVGRVIRVPRTSLESWIVAQEKKN